MEDSCLFSLTGEDSEPGRLVSVELVAEDAEILVLGHLGHELQRGYKY